MKTSFQGFYESYLATCRTNMKLQGHAMRVRYNVQHSIHMIIIYIFRIHLGRTEVHLILRNCYQDLMQYTANLKLNYIIYICIDLGI